MLREIYSCMTRVEELLGAAVGAAVGASVAGVVLIVSLLEIFFMFTKENVLVCCFCPDGGIWESGTMVETTEVVAAPAVGAVAAPEKWRHLGWINCLGRQVGQ